MQTAAHVAMRKKLGFRSDAREIDPSVDTTAISHAPALLDVTKIISVLLGGLAASILAPTPLGYQLDQ